MKRILIYSLLALAVAAASCQNKELLDANRGGGVLPGTDVQVRINWAEGLAVPTSHGMRINLFCLDEGETVAHYGKADVTHEGGTVRLQHNTTHKTLAYNYAGNNLRFRNENDPELIEATASSLVRATYSRTFPEEATVNSIAGDMHVDVHPSYTVQATTDEQIIDVHPADIVQTYTFEVRGIQGAAFIQATRGGLSGMSGSYFLATGELDRNASTVLFDAATNVSTGTITGSFRTFGRLEGSTNNFTIEILYPSQTVGGGIIQQTWDVTDQIATGNSLHIVIENPEGIVIPDEGGASAGGWRVDLNEWNEVTVPLG